MALRIPFSLLVAAPLAVGAANKPLVLPDEPPIQYKSFPAVSPSSTAVATACTDCGSVIAIDHEYGEDAGVLVHVKMDDGRELTVRRASAEDVALGSRVHLREGRVRRF